MNPYYNQALLSNAMYGNYGQQPFQAQQPMQTYQPGISGRFVNDFGEITACDIPMNVPAIFAKNDRSEIQVREWNANGQITTTSYKAVVEEHPAQQFDTNSFLDPIFAKLSELEEKIDKIQKTTTAKKKELEHE